jgi:hypothetical protein
MEFIIRCMKDLYKLEGQCFGMEKLINGFTVCVKELCGERAGQC